MPPGPARGQAAKPYRAEGAKAEAGPGRRLCGRCWGSAGAAGAAAAAGGQEGTGRDGAAPVFPGPSGPPRPAAAEQPRAPAPQGRRALRLLGRSPGGLRPPAPPSSPGLAPLKAKKTKPRGPTAAPGPGRRGSLLSPAAPLPCCARTCGAGGTGAVGALTPRGLLCYLDSVTVF